MDPAVEARLTELAHRESATNYALALAAFSALLATVTGQDKVTVGAYVTARSSVALQNMLGDFSRLVPLCLENRLSATFREWLQAVRTQIVEAQAHAQLPKEQLWEDLRALGQAPPEIEVIFRGLGFTAPSKFGELDLTAHSLHFKDVDSQPLWMTTMPWGFVLRVDFEDEESPCELTFDARTYDPAKVRAFFDVYVQLLERASLSPDQPVQEIIRAAQSRAAR